MHVKFSREFMRYRHSQFLLTPQHTHTKAQIAMSPTNMSKRKANNDSLDEDDTELVLSKPTPETIPEAIKNDLHTTVPLRRLVVSIDFGTTFSAISYVAIDEDDVVANIGLDKIFTIENWPGATHMDNDNHMRLEVPSEVIYPLNRNFRKKFEQEFLEAKANALDPVPEGGLPSPGRSLWDDDDIDYENTDNDASLFDTIDSYQWGYSVHEAWSRPMIHSDEKSKALSRFKLLFDDSPLTEHVRNELKPIMTALKARRVIRNHVNVVADYLACLLRHARSELQKKGLYDNYEIEMVLCIPAIWTQKACRDMQVALTLAMRRANFKGVDLDTNSIENLFLVSEPEAAAAYVLELDQVIAPHDTFVLLDAGGGTVDANTYTVSRTTPLRLTEEIVQPGGGLCGSSYLNEAFRVLLKDKLNDEKYLEQGQVTLDGIVENILLGQFEEKIKRHFDIHDKRRLSERFYCGGLRDNLEKHFRGGEVAIRFSEMRAIFLERLRQIVAIMQHQIDAAFAKGVPVDKVVLIGGFAGSPSLRNELERRLEQSSKRHKHTITPLFKGNRPTAVASGAVLRALNKQDGPRRFPRSNYGIQRREEHGTFDEHKVIKKRKYDPVDGVAWVTTIDWILKKGIALPAAWTYTPFVCSHTFPTKKSQLLCEEVLYVSDGAAESHYAVGHNMNKEAEKVGKVVVDFTFLRDEGKIHPIYDHIPQGKYKGQRIGQPHYQVDYTMVNWVVDRDLQCYAVYGGNIVKKCKINIAAAFSLGVE